MSLKCIFGFHNWGGCKCFRCGKTRNEGHDWVGCWCCNGCGKRRSDPFDKERSSAVGLGRNFYLLSVPTKDRNEALGYYREIVTWLKGNTRNYSGDLFIELAEIARGSPSFAFTKILAVAISGIWPDHKGLSLPERVLADCEIGVDYKSTTVRKREYLERFLRSVERTNITGLGEFQ